MYLNKYHNFGIFFDIYAPMYKRIFYIEISLTFQNEGAIMIGSYNKRYIICFGFPIVIKR